MALALEKRLKLHRSGRLRGSMLFELLIGMSIVAILAALSISSYKIYTRRAHYTEIVQAASAFRLAVHECYAITGELSHCHGGKYGIPKNFGLTTHKSLIESVDVSGAGVITITPKKRYGILPTDKYIMTPEEENNQLIWHISGGGVEHGYAG